MIKICDAHNDFLTEEHSKNYVQKLKKNKSIKKVCCVVWTTKLNNPIDFLIKVKKEVIKRSSKLIFCIEDLGFIKELNFLENMDLIIELKPFSCGIVWNLDNSLGGGTYGKKGLTLLGLSVIKELEKENIIIDTAHMNRKTFYQFCKITTKPIYNSHCNLCYFKDHKRNLNHKQILTIINSNGFIGLSFVQKFVSNNLIDAEIIAKQIKYFISNYGDKNIGIGSDFYGTKNLPVNLKNYNHFKFLYKALKKEGLTKQNIKNVLYKNFERFRNSIKN